MNHTLYINIDKLSLELSLPDFIADKCINITADKPIGNGDITIQILENSGKKMRLVVKDKKKYRIDTIIDRNTAIFHFYVLVEQIIAEELIKTKEHLLVFHGGGVVYKDNAIMVIQGKGAGKTTFIAKMASCNDFQYIADDLIICNSSLEVLSIPFPMRLRNIDIRGFDLKGQFLGSCTDFNGITRHLFLPEQQFAADKAKLDLIMLPQYLSEDRNSFHYIPLYGKMKINALISNIKEVPDIHQFYHDIGHLLDTTSVLNCTYSGDISCMAHECSKLIKERIDCYG